MNEIDKIENKFCEVSEMANEVSKIANKKEKKLKDKLSLYKLIIVCMTIIILSGMVLVFIDNGHKTDKLIELMYSAEIEEDECTQEIETNGDGDAYGIMDTANSSISISK